MISNQSELIQSLTRAGLGNCAQNIAAHAKGAVRFGGDLAGNDADIPIGSSKFGGYPDLPKGFEWPADHLSFLCQIDLSEATRVGGLDGGFPASGRLSLFYDVDAQPWGFDPADRSGFRLIYNETETTRLQRIQPAHPRSPALKSLALSFSRIYSPMPPDSYTASTLTITSDERDDYYDWWDKVLSSSDVDIGHQLGGWPNYIQDEMQLELQYVTNGIYCGDPKGYAEGERRGLQEGARDWTLLMQIVSDEAAGFMWGDLGNLYVWIKQQDLKERNFDGAWLILQCS